MLKLFTLTSDGIGSLSADADEKFRYEIKDILEMEMKILEALNFYLVVFHPYRSLPEWVLCISLVEKWPDTKSFALQVLAGFWTQWHKHDSFNLVSILHFCPFLKAKVVSWCLKVFLWETIGVLSTTLTEWTSSLRIRLISSPSLAFTLLLFTKRKT